MVLGLKPIGKLTTFDNYLSVVKNKGPVCILGPQSLERLIISCVYLSDEQNLRGADPLKSLTLSPFTKDANSSNLLLQRNYHTLPSIEVLCRTKVLNCPCTQTYVESKSS